MTQTATKTQEIIGSIETLSVLELAELNLLERVSTPLRQ